MTDLAGRVAVITGGTRGIGLATVRSLAAAGATVVLTGREERQAKLVAGDLGGSVAGVGLDVTNFSGVAKAFQTIAIQYGRIDIMVASAGILEGAVLGMIREDHVRRVFDVNVFGVLFSVQAAARVMLRQRSGSIVLLSSVVASSGAPGQTAYAASKAAVTAITRSAARELAGRGVRVNAVAPGVIDTNLIAALPPEVLARYHAGAPPGRLGTPEEVAQVIRFLVSDDATFINGQVIGVDGGLVT
ncbi:MAG: SDR family NAD(P)-dependent oxidoreductase [Pseudonocardiaceae bacterium]